MPFSVKDEEQQAVLRAYATGEEQPTLYARGRALQLNGEVARAIRKVGDDIANFISRIWRVGSGTEPRELPALAAGAAVPPHSWR
jgi:hypothetical protein